MGLGKGRERKVGVTFSIVCDTKIHFSWRWIGNQGGSKAEFTVRQTSVKNPVCLIAAVDK